MPAPLTDEQAAQRLDNAGLEPIGPYPGWDRPWPAHCHQAGHRITATLASLKLGRGCCECACRIKVRTARADADLHAAGLPRIGPFHDVSTPVHCVRANCGRRSDPG